jgi:carbon-monoxide dehydrogenase medium subunit
MTESMSGEAAPAVVARRYTPLRQLALLGSGGRVKPAPFAYAVAADAAGAVAALAATPGARLVAGGQALVPLMARRLARPAALVDIGRCADLRGIGMVDGLLRIGAVTPLREIERSDLVRSVAPVVADAAALVGPAHVRSRATVGGSLGHADPAAEIPAALLAAGAAATVVGPAGTRSVLVSDMVVGAHCTALGPADVVTAIEIPRRTGAVGGAFREFATRGGDLPLAGVGCVVQVDADGACADVSVAVCGVADRPMLVPGVADALVGRERLDEDLLAATAALASAMVSDRDDTYRDELAGVLATSAIGAAWRTATERIGALS